MKILGLKIAIKKHLDSNKGPLGKDKQISRAGQPQRTEQQVHLGIKPV
jgi:hypothetical protein